MPVTSEVEAAAARPVAEPVPPPVRPPSYDDVVVREASGLVGGPPGRHARLGGSRFWTPVRVLVLLTLLTFTGGYAQKATCRTHPWTHEYQYTRMCYTDVFALFYAEKLADGQTPYVDHAVEYPVLIGALMEAGSVVARWAAPDHSGAAFFDITAIMLGIGALVVVVTTAKLAGARRPWDAALVALAPGLLLHGLTNWDLAAAALGGLGLLAWARRRPVAAGLLLGLATMTKLYPLLFAVAIVVLAVRAGRTRRALVTLGTTVATSVVIFGVGYAAAGYFNEETGAKTGESLLQRGWERLSGGVVSPAPTSGSNALLRFFHLNQTRGADWDSWQFAFGTLTNHPFPAPPNPATGASGSPQLNLSMYAGWLLVAIALVALVAVAPRRPRLPQVLFLGMVGFVVASKVFSPQYVIWLIPLAALARPRWRAFLAWQATEVLLLFCRFYFFVRNDDPAHAQGLSVELFVASVLLRDVALLVVAGLVVREVLRPDLDVVRADGVDDPAGGDLDGAPDAGWRRALPGRYGGHRHAGQQHDDAEQVAAEPGGEPVEQVSEPAAIPGAVP